MRNSSSHQSDSDLPSSSRAGWGRRRHRSGGASSVGPWALLRSVFGKPSRWSSDTQQQRSSAEMTTQLTVSRGQALRNAHRTLAHHMDTRPVLRQMAPHLSAVERHLARLGSRALGKLPLPVMHQALDQLTLLQSDDDPPGEAEDLRVLRLRLMEAIASRDPRQGLRGGEPDTIAHHETLRGRGVEVRHISVDEFNQAMEEPPPARRSRH